VIDVARSRHGSGSIRTLALIVFMGVAVIAPASSARAQAPAAAETGKSRFDRGVKLYNLGHFQEAIGEFEKAYDLDPAPILLFNIAQSHRQLGNKERALFFYRRYLEQAPSAGNHADVEQRMKDLSQSLEQEKELKQKPPTEVEGSAAAPAAASAASAAPAAPGAPAAAANASPATEAVQAAAAPAVAESHAWIVAAEVAPSFVGFSGKEIDAPVVFTARVGGAYVLPVLGGDRIRVGLEGTISVLPYTTPDGSSKQSSSFWGLLVTGNYVYPILPELIVGGGVGAGVVWWDGLKAGNPFTVDQVAASGAIPMPTFQVGLKIEYLVSRNFFAELAPAFVYSATTSAGLSDSVSAVERFDINVGAGYLF
jgi:hypothetical protein